jgi:hypothetical protein
MHRTHHAVALVGCGAWRRGRRLALSHCGRASTGDETMQTRSRRVDAVNLRRPTAGLLQVAGDATDGTTGPGRADETVDAPTRLRKYSRMTPYHP